MKNEIQFVDHPLQIQLLETVHDKLYIHLCGFEAVYRLKIKIYLHPIKIDFKRTVK